MLREQARIGMKVTFGRRNGAKTSGVIEKLNMKSAKVKTLENRGIRSQAGETWRVPYSLITPIDNKPVVSMVSITKDRLNELERYERIISAQNEVY